MTAGTRKATATWPDRAFVDACGEAAETLDTALALPPKQLGAEVDIAEQQVVCIRDRLIDELRRVSHGQQAGPRRGALNRINVALSLIVGVEYAAGGIQRTPLREARDLLRTLAGSHA